MAWKFLKPGETAAPAAATAPAAAAPAAAPAQAAAAMPAAHPLPPPTTMPAMQIPAAASAPAATAEAPKRRRRSASEMAAAAAPAAAPAAAVATAVMPQLQTPPPAAAPMVPTVIQPAATPATLPAGGWLALFTPVDPSRTAGAAVAAIAAQQGGEQNIFPTVFITGGESGGMLDYDEMNEEGSDDALPVGRKGFAAILLTYRLVLLGWPRGSSGKGGPKVTPKFRGIIASDQGEVADIAAAAAKRYQFRTGRPGPENKGGPEPTWDALCHPALAIEALCFEPEAGIMAVRSTFTYESATFTNDQINGAFPKNEKGIPIISPTPVIIEPHTWKTKGSKGRPEGWDEHGLLFKPATLPPTPEIQAAVSAFQTFYSQAGMDPDLAQATSDWCRHTLSPNDLEILRQITNLPR